MILRKNTLQSRLRYLFSDRQQNIRNTLDRIENSKIMGRET